MTAESARRPAADFGILLATAYQEFVRELHADLATKGFDDLGRSDGFVFRALAREPMTVSALAARLEISKQGAGQLVDDMQGRGLVVRRPDPHDARARLVELSERGHAALAAARAFHGRRERQLIRRHGRAAVESARAVLGSLTDSPGENSPDPRLRAMYL